MADEFQDKLNAVLGNPELMKTIATLAGGFGSNMPEASPSYGESSSPGISEELSSVVSSLNDSNDSRINLLYALKPYMRSSRSSQMDMAIKILKLTKLTSLL